MYGCMRKFVYMLGMLDLLRSVLGFLINKDKVFSSENMYWEIWA